MKKIGLIALVYLLLSLVFGTFLYFIGKDVYPWVLMKQPTIRYEFVLSSLTVFVWFVFVEFTMRLLYRKPNPYKPTLSFHRQRVVKQFLYTFIPSLLFAMLLGAGLMYHLRGEPLR